MKPPKWADSVELKWALRTAYSRSKRCGSKAVAAAATFKVNKQDERAVQEALFCAGSALSE
jgi:hypothetical protein